MGRKELYLTDSQYKRILGKIEKEVNSPGFKVSRFDSTSLWDKYNDSNRGFCNDNFTELDTALFPDKFPGRKSMKYQESNHKCPFDTRKEPGFLGWGSGCFSQCYLFKKECNLETIKTLVKELTND